MEAKLVKESTKNDKIDQNMETSLESDCSNIAIFDSKELPSTSDSTTASGAVADNFYSKRWNNLRKILEHDGPFCSENFLPTDPNLESLMSCKVLVIGAGGLGCELLKDLAMMGFQDIHCIDMDTIELSNLNRQFLFRNNLIGKSKAICAASVINERLVKKKIKKTP